MPQTYYIGPSTKWAAFTDRHSHPLLLDLMLLREFGTEYLGWEPITVWMEIDKTYGVVPSDINKAKIQAARTCHVTNSPYTEWNVFEKVALSLDGSLPRFDTIQKPSPSVCALGLDIMGAIRSDVPVSNEVYKYTAAVLLDDGVAYGPGPLEPANKYLQQVVDSDTANRVKLYVNRGDEPSFDGTNNLDIQIYKSRAITDYVDFHNKLLLKQIDRVLGSVK